jgi:hypothetical protein
MNVSKGSRQNRSVTSGKGLALKAEVLKLMVKAIGSGFWPQGWGLWTVVGAVGSPVSQGMGFGAN